MHPGVGGLQARLRRADGAATLGDGRAERRPNFFASRPVPPNVGLGVTAEDRRYGLPRIDFLRPVAARVRFLSMESLLEDLGPLDLDGIG